MPTPASPSNDTPAGAGGPPPAEHQALADFWKKNGNFVTAACAAVLLAICAKGAWDYLAVQRERSLGQELAAADTPEKLRAFAQAHPDQALGAIARVQLADQAYAAGRLGEALADYQQAAGKLPEGPLAARAQLGLAVTELQTGQATEGQAALRRILGDTVQLNAIRAEAGYQLASYAAAQGRAADVQQLASQILQLDPSSPWAQRAFALQASLPPPSAPSVPAIAAPAVPAGPR